MGRLKVSEGTAEYAKSFVVHARNTKVKKKTTQVRVSLTDKGLPLDVHLALSYLLSSSFTSKPTGDRSTMIRDGKT